MKKDKLDKAIDDFTTGIIPEETVFPRSPDLVAMAADLKQGDYKAIMYKDSHGFKDTYLPYVLVRLGIFTNNADARNHIHESGVILNGKECRDSSATSFSENFTLTVPQFDPEREFQIAKVDEEY